MYIEVVMLTRIGAGTPHVLVEIVVVVEVANGFGDMMAVVVNRQLWEMPSAGCEARARVSTPR